MADLPRETVGLIFAISGEYEEYRARPREVYESVAAAQAEANRRNAIVLAAREKVEALHELEESQEEADWNLADKRRTRLLNKLRRETNDPDIKSQDVYDLRYSVTEARMVR